MIDLFFSQKETILLEKKIETGKHLRKKLNCLFSSWAFYFIAFFTVILFTDEEWNLEEENFQLKESELGK